MAQCTRTRYRMLRALSSVPRLGPTVGTMTTYASIYATRGIAEGTESIRPNGQCIHTCCTCPSSSQALLI